jgi:catechol 2,3-dioxygenase-like lactoylglutathione lyase family enzyme
MRLNHVNLAVPDVVQSRDFFEKYFGFQCLVEPKGKNMIAVMRDVGGLVLTLSNFDGATEVTYPDSFHIGFIQESREEVNAMNERLKADGFDVESPRMFHGSWTFYFRAPGGFLVEVLC